MKGIIDKELADPNYKEHEDWILKNIRERYWQNCLISFFIGALDDGYDFDGAWLLLLNSSVGQGILNHEDRYNGLEGFDVVALAEQETGLVPDRLKAMDCSQWRDLRHLRNLANVVLLAHYRMGIPYEDLFHKMSINEFMFECGIALGDYDDKLIKAYLL